LVDLPSPKNLFNSTGSIFNGVPISHPKFYAKI
jgi:hypothetical protein